MRRRRSTSFGSTRIKFLRDTPMMSAISWVDIFVRSPRARTLGAEPRILATAPRIRSWYDSLRRSRRTLRAAALRLWEFFSQLASGFAFFLNNFFFFRPAGAGRFVPRISVFFYVYTDAIASVTIFLSGTHTIHQENTTIHTQQHKKK